MVRKRGTSPGAGSIRLSINYPGGYLEHSVTSLRHPRGEGKSTTRMIYVLCLFDGTGCGGVICLWQVAEFLDVLEIDVVLLGSSNTRGNVPATWYNSTVVNRTVHWPNNLNTRRTLISIPHLYQHNSFQWPVRCGTFASLDKVNAMCKPSGEETASFVRPGVCNCQLLRHILVDVVAHKSGRHGGAGVVTCARVIRLRFPSIREIRWPSWFPCFRTWPVFAGGVRYVCRLVAVLIQIYSRPNCLVCKACAYLGVTSSRTGRIRTIFVRTTS